jgi:hypothetical protein
MDLQAANRSHEDAHELYQGAHLGLCGTARAALLGSPADVVGDGQHNHRLMYCD